MAGKPTGIWCPICDQNARRSGGSQVNSMLLSDKLGGVNGQMIYKCHLAGHPIEYSKLMTMQPPARKQQLTLTEKQPAGSQRIGVWVQPDALSRLQERWPQNLNTTLYAILNALSDGDTILLEGNHVREMAAIGFNETKGRDIVGIAQEVITLRRTVEQMQSRINILSKRSKSADTAAAGMDPAMTKLVMDMAAKMGITAPQIQPLQATGDEDLSSAMSETGDWQEPVEEVDLQMAGRATEMANADELYYENPNIDSDFDATPPPLPRPTGPRNPAGIPIPSAGRQR